jgi:two-component system response regulator
VEEPIEILLVEDNLDDIELTLRSFKQHHLANRVQVVNDGPEALEFVLGTEPSEPAPGAGLKVILLDLNLPTMNGLKVLRQLKTDPRTRFIPVIVLTGSREGPDVVASFDLGANSYIVKPVDFERFSEAIRALGEYWLTLNQGAQSR